MELAKTEFPESTPRERPCPRAFDYLITSADTPASGGSFGYVAGKYGGSCNATVAAIPPATCKPQDHVKAVVVPPPSEIIIRTALEQSLHSLRLFFFSTANRSFNSNTSFFFIYLY